MKSKALRQPWQLKPTGLKQITARETLGRRGGGVFVCDPRTGYFTVTVTSWKVESEPSLAMARSTYSPGT